MKTFETLKCWAGALKQDILASWFALRNSGMPWTAKSVAFLTVAYALSPIDLIPDFIPVLGYLDDLIIVPALIWVTVKLTPESVMHQSRRQAQEWLVSNQSKPKSYLGLAMVLSIWLGLLWLIFESTP